MIELISEHLNNQKAYQLVNPSNPFSKKLHELKNRSVVEAISSLVKYIPEVSKCYQLEVTNI